ncbi:MAG: DUF456 family protein [Gemmatimonadales bacterium]
MILFLLLCVFAIGLLLIPLGLPGLWVMLLGLIGYGWLTGFQTIGAATIIAAMTLAVLGEVIEAWLGYRYARRYGGSRRAGWGALAGGLVGAVIGLPIPVIGSIVGSFLGSFAGAVLFEYSLARRAGGSLRAGWGAVLGRVFATAAKTALGLVIAVLGVFQAVAG